MIYEIKEVERSGEARVNTRARAQVIYRAVRNILVHLIAINIKDGHDIDGNFGEHICSSFSGSRTELDAITSAQQWRTVLPELSLASASTAQPQQQIRHTFSPKVASKVHNLC